MKVFLNISLELDGEEEELVAQAKDILRSLALPDEARATMTREGDRSAGNLLVPKLEGRGGKQHFNTKKVLIKEII